MKKYPLYATCAKNILPRAKTSGSKAEENGTDELSERGRVHGVQFVLIAMPQVMVVQGAARQTHALGGLVVIHQPLNLK